MFQWLVSLFRRLNRDFELVDYLGLADALTQLLWPKRNVEILLRLVLRFARYDSIYRH
jgi:hypothetical protein